MAYKHVIRAKTKNLFNVNSEWERVIAPLTDVNLSIEGNTISGTDLADGVSAIISPTKIPISTNKVYYTSGQCSGQPSILVRLTDESGEVLTTGIAETYYPYNQYYKAFIVYLNGTFSITNDNAKYLQLGLRFAKGTSTSIRVTFTNIQVELGSTPTPYTPYNYLQSNKRMIKVSDVCQLLDKSNYEVTSTKVGITWTNNGDGTVTANGNVVSGTIYSAYRISLPQFREVKNNHKYALFSGINNINVAYVECIVYLIKKNGSYFFKNCVETNIAGTFGFTISQGEYSLLQCVELRVRADYTANNLVFKPQLYDLTEMYGSGHEPATVAEFRQRFPNELYPYSPQCWLTSYKSAVVCKTKNLFDVNNAAPYAFYDYNPPSDQLFVKDGIYTTKLNNYNLGCGLRIKDGWQLPAGVYTLSVKVVDSSDFGVNGFANTGFYYKTADGTWHELTGRHHSYAPGKTLAFATNIPEHIELRLYLNYQNMNGQPLAGYISYKDIQVEQGSTPTSYVPYQHL